MDEYSDYTKDYYHRLKIVFSFIQVPYRGNVCHELTKKLNQLHFSTTPESSKIRIAYVQVNKLYCDNREDTKNETESSEYPTTIVAYCWCALEAKATKVLTTHTQKNGCKISTNFRLKG